MDHIGRQQSNRTVGGIVGAVFDIAAAAYGIPTHGAARRAGARAGESAYSQAFEAEADYLGLYFVSRAGFDTSRAPDFWRKMGVEGQAAIYESYRATHPSTPERAAALRQTIDEIRSKISNAEPLIPARLDTTVDEKQPEEKTGK